VSDNWTRLRDCFVNALGIEASQVVDSLAYNGVRAWDSVGHMALMSEIESSFGIMLDTNDILDLNTVARAREILGKYGVTF